MLAAWENCLLCEIHCERRSPQQRVSSPHPLVSPPLHQGWLRSTFCRFSPVSHRFWWVLIFIFFFCPGDTFFCQYSCWVLVCVEERCWRWVCRGSVLSSLGQNSKSITGHLLGLAGLEPQPPRHHAGTDLCFWSATGRGCGACALQHLIQKPERTQVGLEVLHK